MMRAQGVLRQYGVDYDLRAADERQRRHLEDVPLYDPKIESITNLEMGEKFTPANRAALSLGLPFTKTLEGRKNIIQANVPGVKFKTIDYSKTVGEPGFGITTTHPLSVMEVNGKQYYVDDPRTFSGQTLQDVVVPGVASIPAALVGAPALGLAGTAGVLAGVGSAGIVGAATDLAGQTISRLAGSGEKYDLEQAGVAGGLNAAAPVVGKIIGAFTKNIPKGFEGTAAKGTPIDKDATAILQKTIADTSKAIIDHPDAMILDTPYFQTMASTYIKNNPNDKAANKIITALENRQAGTASRIDNDLKDAFGTMKRSEREEAKTLANAKQNLSAQLTQALENVGPIDLTKVLNKLDELEAKAGPNSPQKAIVQKARSMLVQEGRFGLAVPVTDAQQIQNALYAIDQVIKYGDGANGVIAPRSFSPTDIFPLNIRQSISETLKDSSKKYSEIMGKYSNIYGRLDANELGSEIFSNKMRPEDVIAIMANPELRQSFMIGARSAVEDKLRKEPNILRVIGKMTGPEDNYLQQKLNKIFGDKTIAKLGDLAEREMNFANSYNTFKEAEKIGQNAIAARKASAFDKPLIDPNMPLHPAYQVASKALAPLVSPWKAGQTQRMGMAGFQTLQMGEGSQRYFDQMSRDKVLKTLNRLSAVGMGSIPPSEKTEIPGQIGSIYDANTRRIKSFAENVRPQRATGGKVGSVDHVREAANLIAAAERAKRAHGEATKPLLEEHDDTIVHALKVANDAI
jgi:hypothetical protein